MEIVVLEGYFDGDEGGNWTLDEFANNIVREREGKKPLLTGDVILTLNSGMDLWVIFHLWIIQAGQEVVSSDWGLDC